ncbi:hypothetical protein OnM2_014028 [Erysiphe neolycopersici]|uniref:Uncharacterized protein n=1 Tax=Erysiphe neolycopersici TaxID=212602 RepID=A0A420I5I4_9PEZI|nr:hypothetical protein OnM2_014028 [Erysiphe neolycopersici]
MIVVSTTKSEIMALKTIGRELSSTKRLYASIPLEPECYTPLLCDNLQTVGCVTKHYPQITSKIRHRFTSPLAKPDEDFTKSLGIEKHREFVIHLELCDASS